MFSKCSPNVQKEAQNGNFNLWKCVHMVNRPWENLWQGHIWPRRPFGGRNSLKKFAWKNLDGFFIFCQRVLISKKASNNSNKELSLLSPNPKYSLPPNSPAAGILGPDLVPISLHYFNYWWVSCDHRHRRKARQPIIKIQSNLTRGHWACNSVKPLLLKVDVLHSSGTVQLEIRRHISQ